MQDTAKPATRVLIVDDHPVVLSGCRTLFERHDGNAIFPAEHFVQDDNQVRKFVIVDVDEQRAVLVQEVSQQRRGRVDHPQPYRMLDHGQNGEAIVFR
jgi:hypothetical protein